MTHDYSEFKEDMPIGDNLLTALIETADQMEAAEKLVESLEAQLAEAKENLKQIAERTLPHMLEGMDADIRLPDGRVVKIGEKVRASIKAENKPLAFKYLEDNGHDALIKRTFTIAFGKNEAEWADKFEAELASSSRPLNVKRDQSVHPQTLVSWVRQQLAEGAEIPMDIFGVYQQRVATVK